MNVGIIVAAGKSKRMGPDVDKAFLSLGPKPVVAYSLQAYEKCPDISSVILVVRKDRIEAAHAVVQMFGCAKVTRIVAGGTERQDSVRAGLDTLPDEAEVVSIHDGARPLVTPALISGTIAMACRHGAGVAASKLTDTIKHVERGDKITRTVDRTRLWAVQTPQTFKVALIRKAFANLRKSRRVVTDDSSAVELVWRDVRLVPTTLPNLKITTADDLAVAAALLRL